MEEALDLPADAVQLGLAGPQDHKIVHIAHIPPPAQLFLPEMVEVIEVDVGEELARQVADRDAAGQRIAGRVFFGLLKSRFPVVGPFRRAVAEVKANWPTMRAAWEILHTELPGMTACVAASDAAREAQLRDAMPGAPWPGGMHVVTGDATAVLDWSDAALVVSGTATLHAAVRRAPMVVMYNVSPASWHLLGRWLVSTRTFSLPNLLAERLGLGRVAPELVPHFGAVEPVVEALRPLLRAGEAREAQRAAFETIAQQFEGCDFASASADALLAKVDGQGAAAVRTSA